MGLKFNFYRLLLNLIIGFCFSYLLTAFVKTELNFMLWGESARVGSIVFGIIVTIVISVLVFAERE